jgi:predicted hotdog family 3-hydroxylacyl-ACP dehydratase
VNGGHALPMPAELLIPHRKPMRLVETLLSRNEGDGVTASCIPGDAPVAGTGGALDEVLFAELIAQSYAAIKGHIDRVAGKPPGKGYLVGITRLKISGAALPGDHLVTSVRTVGSFAGFAVIEGTVARGDETLASGTMKLWIAGEDAGGGP